MSDVNGAAALDQAGPVLQQAAARLRDTGVSDLYVAQIERLAAQVHDPCVVAVVGRVKAGKSTFINALLGEDLAKTGVEETTATVNAFRHGHANPDRPVRCHWHDGQVTDETRAFLDSLQGNDDATLRRAENIDHLEYRLPNPYLEQITLVDTPGVGAAVEEHGERTEAFMRLRERHDQETRRLASEADAVIYLTGQIANTGDQAMLDEFRRVTTGQTSALTAIGVLAKIDIDPEIVANRWALTARLEKQLGASLTIVMPVSAGLRRALDTLLADDGAGITRLQAAIASMPSGLLAKLLASEEFWTDLDHPDCPLTTDERTEMLGTLPWTVFTIIVSTLATSVTAEMAVERLGEIAGFETLRTVLDRRFLRRGRFLRTYRIVTNARAIVAEIRRSHLPALHHQARQDASHRERFLAFIDGANGNPDTAAELASFVREHLGTASPDDTIEAIDRDLAELFWALEEHNADHEALQEVEDREDLFPEAGELRVLFGLYDTDPGRRLLPEHSAVEAVTDRQEYWRGIEMMARSPIRREVAARAVYRYGSALDEMLGIET